MPDETNDRRIRVYALGGASAHWRKHSGIEALVGDNVAAVNKASDLTVTSINSQYSQIGNAVVVGSTIGTAMSNAIGNLPYYVGGTDNLLSVSPTVQYGIADNLGDHEKSSLWDLVILNSKFLSVAKDEITKGETGTPIMAADQDSVTRYKKRTTTECFFGLFDARDTSSAWLSKWLNDEIVQKYAIEIKRAFKERSVAQQKASKESPADTQRNDFASATDATLIQHALRRSYLVLNKALGLQASASQQKLRDKDREIAAKANFIANTPLNSTLSDTTKHRKNSVSFETSASGKIKKGLTPLPSSSDEGKPKSAARRKFSIVDQVSDVYTRSRVDRLKSVPIGEAEETSSAANISIAETPELTINIHVEEPSAQVDPYTQDDSDSDDEPSSFDEQNKKLLTSGCSALVALLAQNQLFVANCGDSMAVLCRNGSALPVTVRHTLFSFQSANEKPRRVEDQPVDDKKSVQAPFDKLANSVAPPSDVKPAASVEWDSFARRELMRVRHCASSISRDGLLSDRTLHTRGFGNFYELPSVNAAPYITVTDLNDQDEFLIIGSASFWKTMTHQTAVDIARLKADDALEASMVLRDFAVAYSQQAVYTVDEDSEIPEDKIKLKSLKDFDGSNNDVVRCRRQDAISVMVINVKDWLGGKPKKIFAKIKRKRDETVDSVCFCLLLSR